MTRDHGDLLRPTPRQLDCRLIHFRIRFVRSHGVAAEVQVPHKRRGMCLGHVDHDGRVAVGQCAPAQLEVISRSHEVLK